MKSGAISDYVDPGATPSSTRATAPELNSDHRRISTFLYWAGLAAILLVAFLVRVPGGFSRLILHDEFYHYFAGLSFARDGTLAIGDGRYVRAAPYTVLTGLSMEAFGNGLLALRLPAIISGTLLVLAVAVWLGRASRMAGLIGGALLAIDYFAIQLSDYARFYTLHALMVWLAAIGSCALMTRRHRPEVSLSLIAATGVALALAMNLQILTLFVVAALIVWAVADQALFSPGRRLLALDRRVGIALCCAAVAAVAIVLLSPIGRPILSLYDRFWNVAQWSEDLSNDHLFYLRFMRSYGILTYLFPLALVAAWRVDRRRTLFCAILFIVPVVIASIGPQKAPRYIFYAIPFFLGIWGLAGAWTVGATRQWIERRRFPSWVTPLMAATAIVALMVGTTSFRSTLGKMRRFARTGEVVSPQEMAKDKSFDWRPWMPILRRAVPSPGIIVGVDDLRTLYFFGRLDLMLNQTIQWDVSRQEFVRDPRTGVPAISQPDSIRLVTECTASGTIIVPLGRWRDYSVIPATADAIEQRAVRVALPHGMPFRVFTWRNRSVPHSRRCQRIDLSVR